MIVYEHEGAHDVAFALQIAWLLSNVKGKRLVLSDYSTLYTTLRYLVSNAGKMKS